MADRPVLPDNEIEITPAMIEAGSVMLQLCFSADGQMDDAPSVIESIFRVMIAARASEAELPVK